MINVGKAVLRFLGVDRAVFFANAGQVTRLITTPISMALVLRYLTPEIQGYFYAFSGVVAMQVFLEMGFSQNILQFASHEFAKLRFAPDSTLEGDPEALSRLTSLARLAFCYYAVAALAVLLLIGVGGHIFFSISSPHGVSWQGAWWIIASVAAASLAINPAWALLEGCNQVAIIARFRFWASMVAFGTNAGFLIAGTGIYASALMALCNLLFALGYLCIFWLPFFRQFLQKPKLGNISWRNEIWPFQWRIAVSWMAGYFIFDIVNPIAFYFCGPVDAGRFGMSFQIIRIISGIAMTWITTKAPRIGMLVARQQWAELDALWWRSTIQAFAIFLVGLAAFFALLPFSAYFLPQLPTRLGPPAVALWLGAGMAAAIWVTAMAVQLRAHKREPYMWISVANALLSVAFILPLVKHWGIIGEAAGYTLGIWAILIPAIRIYKTKKREYRSAAKANSPEGSSPQYLSESVAST